MSEAKQNVMVDLETLAQVPGGVILSIGAVFFDAEGVEDGKGLYKVIEKGSAVKAGLFIDPDTEKWWAQQSESARDVLTLAAAGGEGTATLEGALQEFNTFVSRGGTKVVKVWGNGSDFDNAFLSAAYRAAGLKPGWDFWNNRCYRTLKNLNPHIKLRRKGVAHNAYDDALTQAEHAVEILRALHHP